MINLIRKIFKKPEPNNSNLLTQEESKEFAKAIIEMNSYDWRAVEQAREMVIAEDARWGNFNLPSIRNWITDHPAKLQTSLDVRVDEFLQMFCLGLCVYFQEDFNDVRDVKDFKNRLTLYNDQLLVRKFEYNIMNKMYCLAEASFPDHYEALCNCRPERLTSKIQDAIISGSRKRLKETLSWIEASEFGFQHMILAHMNEGGRDTWMHNR